MADTLSPDERRERMSRIKNAHTRPEMRVRKLVHGMGFRYRLHRRDLPGCPDLVFLARRAVIFVHGCFWHRHDDPLCKLARLPKSRLEFWVPKLENNRLRDKRNQARLKQAGWRVLVLWECELGETSKLEARIRAFLQK